MILSLRRQAHEFVHTQLETDWYVKMLRSTQNALLPLYEEYVAILEKVWFQSDLDDLLLMDKHQFAKIFNAMAQEGNINCPSAYVWRSVHNHAKEKASELPHENFPR